MLIELEQHAKENGIDKGEMIGEIRLAQKFLKRPLRPVEKPAQKTMQELKTMLQELEAELAKFNEFRNVASRELRVMSDTRSSLQ